MSIYKKMSNYQYPNNFSQNTNFPQNVNFPPQNNNFSSFNNFGQSTRMVNKDSTYNTVGGSHAEYVNNKETFNKRIFERNQQQVESFNIYNSNPHYFNENYKEFRQNIQEKDNRMFEINPVSHKKPFVGFVDFREQSTFPTVASNNVQNNNNQIDGNSYFKGNYSDYI
jgi:hypothetical protein